MAIKPQSPLDSLLNLAKGIAKNGKKSVNPLTLGLGVGVINPFKSRDIGTLTGNEKLNNTKTGIAVNTVLGLPKAGLDTLQQMGQASMRGFGAVGAKLASGNINAQFKPQGQFQKELYGTDKPIDFTSVGQELTQKNIPVLTPAIGAFLSTADVFPGARPVGKLAKDAKVLYRSMTPAERQAGKIVAKNPFAVQVPEYVTKRMYSDDIQYIVDNIDRLRQKKPIQDPVIDARWEDFLKKAGIDGTSSISSQIDKLQKILDGNTDVPRALMKPQSPQTVDGQILKKLGVSDTPVKTRQPIRGDKGRFAGSKMQESFGGVAGIEIDEEGNINFDPMKAAAGVAGVGLLNKTKGKFNPKVANLNTELEIIEDTIKNHPAKNLIKYMNKKTGELPQVTGQAKSKFGTRGDDIVTEFGYEDTSKLMDSVDEYKRLQAKAKDLKNQIASEKITEVENLKNARMAKPVDNLAEEAKKYKSAEEFVKAQGETVFRGGQPYKKELLNSTDLRGLPVTRDRGVAESFADSISPSDKYQGGLINKGKTGTVEDIVITKDAKILPVNSAPKGLQNIFRKESRHKGVEEISKWAEKNGYDAVDFGDFELRVLNPDVIQTKSQLTDIWNKANKPTRLSAEGIPLAVPSRLKNQKLPSVTRSVESPRLQQPQPLKSSLAREFDNISTQNIPQGTEMKSVQSEIERLRVRAEANNGVKLPSLSKMIESKQTPVNKKVGILDYLRTPDRVLNKIGLGNEAKLVREQYEKYIQELPKNIEKITEWTKQVPEESNQRIFKHLDGQDISLNAQEQKVANEIKDWLKEWADRLGLPEDKRVSNYITRLFDDQLIQKEFDEDLAKIISTKIPGSVYDPFLQKRLGALGYKEDTWAALDAYVKRGTRKVHMDPALEKLEQAGQSLEESQWNFVKRYADKVNMRPSEIDNLVDNQFKRVFGYRFGQRPVAAISRIMRQMAYRGLLGGNLGSALRNLSQGINTYAKLGEKYTAVGYSKLLTSGTDELKRVGVLADNFIQDRALSSSKKMIEKLDKALFFFFDNAEKINRGAAYYGAKAKALSQGMSEEKAIEFAKKIVRDTQFTFGSVDTPVALQNDIVKVLTQMQSFTVKQTEFFVEMAKNKEFLGLLRYAIGGTLFVATIGKAFGMEPEELIPSVRLGTPPALKGIYEGGKALFNAPDKYGKERDTGTKIKDVGESFIGMLPGGIQAKKTYQGVQANLESGSYDKAGNKQFDTGQTTGSQVQNILFGKYASREAKDYFDKKKPEKTFSEIKKGIADDLKSGKIDMAVAKQRYVSELKTYKTEARKARSEMSANQFKKELAKAIEEKSVTMEEAKKEFIEYTQKIKTAETRALQMETEYPKKNIVQLVTVYAKALGTDPSNAFKAMMTGEKIDEVEGNAVTLQRMKGIHYLDKEGSEDYIKKQLKKMGISEKDREKYNLEHIVPVSAGGDNSDSNLQIISRDLHNKYTVWDTAAGKAVKENKKTRREIAKIAKDLKINRSITVEEALKLLE